MKRRSSEQDRIEKWMSVTCNKSKGNWLRCLCRRVWVLEEVKIDLEQGTGLVFLLWLRGGLDHPLVFFLFLSLFPFIRLDFKKKRKEMPPSCLLACKWDKSKGKMRKKQFLFPPVECSLMRINDNQMNDWMKIFRLTLSVRFLLPACVCGQFFATLNRYTDTHTHTHTFILLRLTSGVRTFVPRIRVWETWSASVRTSNIASRTQLRVSSRVRRFASSIAKGEREKAAWVTATVSGFYISFSLLFSLSLSLSLSFSFPA